jgi:NAD(P)-dependent dehydrogenase (short-subunit alcohol dehydrogenase family)
MVTETSDLRSCVVTGAGTGIGRATAKALVAEGWFVVALGRRSELLDTLVAEVVDPHRLRPLPGDVTDGEALVLAADTAESMAPLTGWVNNAALFERAPLHELTEAGLRTMLQTDLEAAILASALAVRRFLAAGTGGAIVNVSSIHARQAFSGWAAYDIAKAGIEGLTRSTAVDYGSAGIRANAVAPGYIAIERYYEALAALSPAERAEEERKMELVSPAGRAGRPDEVAAAICFLLGDSASYINGATLAVDGGTSIHQRDVI